MRYELVLLWIVVFRIDGVSNTIDCRTQVDVRSTFGDAANAPPQAQQGNTFALKNGADIQAEAPMSQGERHRHCHDGVTTTLSNVVHINEIKFSGFKTIYLVQFASDVPTDGFLS